MVIAEWNANGISSHINEIEVFLHNYFIDILLVSETHFTSKSYFRTKVYDTITANHPDNIRYEVANPIREPFCKQQALKLFVIIQTYLYTLCVFP